MDKDLAILNRAKDKPSFFSARWQRSYNPDLAFVSSQHQNFRRSVRDPITNSQYGPITVHLAPVVNRKPHPRSNFRKANWEAFTSDLEEGIEDADPTLGGYDSPLTSVRKNISRGCRKRYIPDLSDTSRKIYTWYANSHDADPFAEETINQRKSTCIPQ